MRIFKNMWVLVVCVGLSVLATVLIAFTGDSSKWNKEDYLPGHRAHLDHSPYFDEPFATGHEVTRACLECHEEAGRDMMLTSHFQWVGDEVLDPRTGQMLAVGKKNLINNFCISIQGNWESCNRCHAGYGWQDETFNFSDPENVDCLVCHDWSGTYRKSGSGYPHESVDLQASARSVGYPKRDNCGVCHSFGGGGLGVKHGDLDSSLDNPGQYDDVHMGRAGMLCTDCHGGAGHNIKGKAFSVSVNHDNGIDCIDCHVANPHQDSRLDTHSERIACQTCHIPFFAGSIPTKTWWDWSSAGDDSRQDDTHHYLKIKGDFEYDQQIIPEYYWFDLNVDRYLTGDKINTTGPTSINRLHGDRTSSSAKIWPFKVHRGRQPADMVNQYLIPPVTSGEQGYWSEFDWDLALRLGAENVGLDYSGDFGFVETQMFWPLSHMVQPKEKTLQCTDCHGENSRLNWSELGYSDDPMKANQQTAAASFAGGQQ